MDVSGNGQMSLEITRLLEEWQQGESHALNRLLPQVYENLRKMAGAMFRGEKQGTLCTTALVNEVYLRMANSEWVKFRDRNHFFGVAGRMMRHILVEHARKRLTEKRGAHLQVSLHEDTDVAAFTAMDLPTLITLGDGIEELEKRHPRAARILEWRIFGGLKFGEIAEMDNISLSTVKREWELAKQHLFLYLKLR